MEGTFSSRGGGSFHSSKIKRMFAEEGGTACRNIREQKNVEHYSNIEAVIDPSGSDHVVSSPYVDSSLAVLGKT